MMSATARLRGYRRLRFQVTRDAKIPLSDDDREMDLSWQCVPIPPTIDPGWFIFDSDHSDYKTTWAIPIDDGAP